MAQFKPKAEYAAQPIADPSRASLASAITERQQATRALEDAKAAVSRAEEAQFGAMDKLRALRRQDADPEPVDAVSAILSGDLLSVERPDAKAIEITEIEREIERWRAARIKAEEAVEARTRALAEAEKLVDKAARIALGGSINVAAMLEEAETAADWLRDRRALFLFLMSILPPGQEHDALSHFMGRPWLADELTDAWKRNASIEPYAQALKRLSVDANAPIEVAK